MAAPSVVFIMFRIDQRHLTATSINFVIVTDCNRRVIKILLEFVIVY